MCKKQLYSLVAFLVGFLSVQLYFYFYCHHDKTKNIFDAIAIVETGNDNSKIGEMGEIGKFQISKIYVEDVNRILGKDKYSLDDALNEERAKEMMIIYWSNYCKIGSDEEKSRIHNGGPNGMKKESTIKYWEKVKEALNGSKRIHD